MQKIKKILFLSLGVVFIGGINLSHAQGNVGFGSHENVQDIQGIAGTETAETSSKLLDTIKNFINWTLGMLSLVALVVLLWGGFQMVTAAGDENKHKKGYTILKQAAIGLIFVGLSWLIVSLIFWLINTMAGPK